MQIASWNSVLHVFTLSLPFLEYPLWNVQSVDRDLHWGPNRKVCCFLLIYYFFILLAFFIPSHLEFWFKKNHRLHLSFVPRARVKWRVRPLFSAANLDSRLSVHLAPGPQSSSLMSNKSVLNKSLFLFLQGATVQCYWHNALRHEESSVGPWLDQPSESKFVSTLIQLPLYFCWRILNHRKDIEVL